MLRFRKFAVAVDAFIMGPSSIFFVAVARTPGAPPILLRGKTSPPACWVCRATDNSTRPFASLW